MFIEALKRIYHDPNDPGSLGGVERLLRRSRQLHIPGVNKKRVQEFLQSEQVYTLHKPARRRLSRNHTYVAGIDGQRRSDLADMQGIARLNGGLKYLLTVIAVFSKFAWAMPVHSIDAKAITAAFGQVLIAANPRHPRRLHNNKGKEFFNSDFTALMKRNGIQHFASDSELKAAVVKRFNRTIKTMIWTYLSDRGTVGWVDVIQELVDAYNHSRHRSIGMAPVDIQKKDEDRLWVRFFWDGDTHLKPPIPQGAMVRASSHKTIFDKGYMLNWTK